MVSFSCEACGDVLTKKKLDPHRNRCRGASFTCIDCMVHFYGTEYRTHTSCMTEDQKYQGALYKNKKAKTTRTDTPSAPPREMAHAAYVEDYADNGEWEDAPEAMPHAPSPPPLNEMVNVFDYMVNATPTASSLALPQTTEIVEETTESTQLVRYDYDANAGVDMVDDEGPLVEYGDGSIPVGMSAYETPVPKIARERRKKDGDKEVKKDKKRKRLHIDTHDHEMTDAPPVLHSNLTGGMNRLMSRNHFPPSPDYSGSGGDVADTPASPLKKSKSKHTKSGRGETSISNNLMSMLTSGSSKTKAKTKTKKVKQPSTTTTKKHRHGQKRLEGKETKLLEYKPGSKDNEKDGGAMVVFKPRADLFLSFVNKGPDSERGCSVNKALKRFHRQRTDSGNSMTRSKEEKELFKSLRMRKNERGEIVLFCI